MTDDVRTLVVQLAVAKAVSDQCKAVTEAVKTRLEVAMDPGDRKTAKIGGHDIGTVSYAKSSASTTATITDEEKFTAWVAENHDTEVTAPVTLEAHRVLMALVLASEDGSGEAVTEVMEACAAAKVRVRPAFASKVLAGCQKAKAAVYVETGEEVPGVTVTVDPGGEGKYVSARISEAQMEALSQAYQDGDLTHLAMIEMATIPPAIGGA